MLEDLLATGESIKNPPQVPADESGEITYAALEDLLPSFMHSMTRLPFIVNRLERILRRKARRKRRQATEMAEYVSLKQAAIITGLSYKHVRAAVLSGDLRASNVGAGTHSIYRIARSDLAEWMKKKQGGSRVPPKSRLKELINRHLPDL
jgi:excisionase family DNA binding protein